MSDMLTIQLAQPITQVRVLHAADVDPSPKTSDERRETASRARSARMAAEMEQHKSRFDQLCQTVGNLAGSLEKLHQETLANHRSDIAKLAVEIARKILLSKVGRGDYDIQAIIEEALKRAPTRQGIVIRLNPEDLPPCQQYQQENPDSPFAGLEFAADWGVGRGECLVETPKGIVKSFIEEHLERISEALQKVE